MTTNSATLPLPSPSPRAENGTIHDEPVDATAPDVRDALVGPDAIGRQAGN